MSLIQPTRVAFDDPDLRNKRAALVAELRTFLPDDSVLEREEEVRPYECDGLSAYRQLPLLVVLPRTVAEVQRILRLCHERRVPVVARGAGTGLSGGALPLPDGLLLSLARFNRILELDPIGRTARVQPGVRNLAISEAVCPQGLYYAPDPSSQIACTIGGNVAENSGGVHCLKYGLTVHNVLSVTFVTLEGELIELGSAALDSAGYDLLALFVGSEGMLGVMVEARVKLLPIPERAQALLAAFDDVERAGRAVGDIIAAGIIPAGLEMMDGPAIQAAEDFVHAGYPTEAAAILLCELDGTNQEVSEQVMQVRNLLLDSGATEVRTSQNEAERLRFWQGRKAAFPAVGRISPDYYCMDGTIPRRALPEVLRRTAELSQEYGLRVANVFHAGDGNLHPLILFDANQPGELERTEELGGRLLELCVEVGGTITGEHGVGIEKINQMCVQFTPEELRQFHAVKAAFDPLGLLNPGKGVPTPRRCSEYRLSTPAASGQPCQHHPRPAALS
ncbi:FAD-linked oxidase C-terminal domain-containing protein [Allochromatium vinosum]|uniref:Glycolate oxidase, subunit GlcD n=1 Tax=Allochromatium vinosum (strain ATCC 17899 / DSM 180 / NBRC 103801 / NCIMB 10441 / D) TaxID=572477 RepID=D3RUJ6_ALLVD|nr:FAD-linked oxidase C-terminal domain-containing protein [Allochromatium vinosum]ADC62855.1 glycolate oxidase, subunit GlcD [Allochromatium vinosum DSM 180]